MSYTIGFAPRGRKATSTTEQPTASAALRLVEALERSDEEIRYIRGPSGYDLSKQDLANLIAQDAPS